MSNCWNITRHSRDYLRSLPEQRRRDAITQTVRSFEGQIIQAANFGKTSHLVDLKQYDKMRKSGVSCNPPPYIPSNEDLLEGFKIMFPDCRVEYAETWEDVRPGVREQKKGILIDWS